LILAGPGDLPCAVTCGDTGGKARCRNRRVRGVGGRGVVGGARVGSYQQTLLAITPTWRHMDPPPVLSRDHDEAAGGWDDPVGEEATQEDAS